MTVLGSIATASGQSASANASRMQTRVGNMSDTLVAIETIPVHFLIKEMGPYVKPAGITLSGGQNENVVWMIIHD